MGPLSPPIIICQLHFPISYNSFGGCICSCCSLAEALDMELPVLPEDGHTTRVTTGEDTLSPSSGKDSSVLEAMWDDEDTRAFYESLPDLRYIIVAQLYQQ